MDIEGYRWGIEGLTCDFGLAALSAVGLGLGFRVCEQRVWGVTRLSGFRNRVHVEV